jgi:hypothetical protein
MATEKKAVEKVAKTPEQIKAAEAKKLVRVEARKRILTFVSENSEQLGKLANDIRMFVGSERGPRVVKASINQALRTALLEAGQKGLTEMDIFKMFKVGRPEMVTKIRILVLCPNPADRVWVKFNEKSETYVVVGKGAQPPKEWDGYIPSSKETL